MLRCSVEVRLVHPLLRNNLVYLHEGLIITQLIEHVLWTHHKLILLGTT